MLSSLGESMSPVILIYKCSRQTFLGRSPCDSLVLKDYNFSVKVIYVNGMKTNPSTHVLFHSKAHSLISLFTEPPLDWVCFGSFRLTSLDCV